MSVARRSVVVLRSEYLLPHEVTNICCWESQKCWRREPKWPIIRVNFGFLRMFLTSSCFWEETSDIWWYIWEKLSRERHEEKGKVEWDEGKMRKVGKCVRKQSRTRLSLKSQISYVVYVYEISCFINFVTINIGEYFWLFLKRSDENPFWICRKKNEFCSVNMSRRSIKNIMLIFMFCWFQFWCHDMSIKLCRVIDIVCNFDFSQILMTSSKTLVEYEKYDKLIFMRWRRYVLMLLDYLFLFANENFHSIITISIFMTLLPSLEQHAMDIIDFSPISCEFISEEIVNIFICARVKQAHEKCSTIWNMIRSDRVEKIMNYSQACQATSELGQELFISVAFNRSEKNT